MLLTGYFFNGSHSSIPSFFFGYIFLVGLLRRFYDFFELCTAPVTALLAEGVDAKISVSTDMGKPVGLKFV